MNERIAFLTYADVPGFDPDDLLAAEILRARGIAVDAVVWDAESIEWRAYDAVIVRSAWDYHHKLKRFISWLTAREAEGVTLWNDYATIRWNMDKTYLLRFAQAELPVIPTELCVAGGGCDLKRIMETRGWDAVVVKPVFSASAHDTYRVDRASAQGQQEIIDTLNVRRDLFVQPYLRRIETDGEWSLLFFNGRFSHALVKRPQRGDFRVQSEYGGTLQGMTPPPALLEQARRIVAAVPEPWLYARVDGVFDGESFLLMELEMLEPLLYLATDAAAPGRFAAAVVERLNGTA